ncbi:MAG: energy transducer TonB, partial [Chitinispirillaceae bacterium]|nr:energy transducer TonB [Chitinispirillaceae bacterium]
MEYNSDGTTAGRWIVSGAIAAGSMLLFLLLAVSAYRDRRIPDLGPLLELDYVTIEEPRKETLKEPPQVKPCKVKKETVTEPVPNPAPEETVSLPEIIETVPTQTETAKLPAAPAEPVPSTPVQQPFRIGSPAELDNIGFEPISNPKPDYPAVALEARITGYVDIDLVIGDNGKVRSFTVVTVKGHPAFAAAVA